MVIPVIDGALRAIAVVTSATIALSFALFAAEQARHPEWAQLSATIDPGPAQAQARAAAHTWAREAIDDADDVLLAPFAGVSANAGSPWARRGFPALLGLLAYGVGLAFLARLLDVRSHTLVRHTAPPP
jgi:hypothetical protein